MRELDDLFARLWDGYVAITPQAARLHELLRGRGERIVNDHVALRTFDLPGVGIESIERAFVAGGYQAAADYEFPERKLHAYHYEHAQAGRPKLFVSALEVSELSREAQGIIGELVGHVPPGAEAHPHFAASGRRWPIDHARYQALRTESEYAAWLAAFGFRANHFTVSVNHLTTFPGLAELDDFLVEQGFHLNEEGGRIKGSPEAGLEQSSTRADEVPVEMTDGTHAIPSCYVELARRHPLPDGTLFSGFIETSATHLFTSTEPR